MKRYRLFFVLISSFMFIELAYCSLEKYWVAVDSALQNGLPQTAVQNLDTILTIAQQEKEYNEWMRALSQKIVIEATIQGNKPEEKVKRLKEEFIHADSNTRPLLQAILAQWYWQYYNRNRWRFINRTATEKMSEEDFTTWDLPKIFHEIDSLYSSILRDKNKLTRIPTEDFIGFLEPGSIELRPTLYDFIAHEALVFYTSAEQAAAQPEDAFEIDAHSDAFAPAEQFLQFKPITDDTTSSKYKALKLYQSLMAYHKEAKNAEPFLALNIERLNYMKNVAYGEDRNQIFIQQMKDLVEKDTNYPIMCLGAFYLAKALAEQGDVLQAYNVAKKGYESYPNSIGGESCRSEMINLMAKALTLTGEKCVPPGTSAIQISYKNIKKIYFKIYADSWDDFLKSGATYPNQIDDKKITQLLNTDPVAEWKVELPATDDLKEKSMTVDVPKLKSGYYRIFASWQPDFGISTMVQHTWLWVCSYTLVSRSGAGIIDGLVMDAVTGEPISGAEVSQIVRPTYQSFQFGAKSTTDRNGYFKFYNNSSGYLLYLKNGNEELLQSDYMYSNREYMQQPNDGVVFFTDRSIYRPGQSIYFKGICRHVDQERGIYEIIPNRDVIVHFHDVNNQEIAKQTFRTNDFGSFSGQFTAPTDRLNGQMNLQSENPPGSVSIRVEEYKRPKFSVNIAAPKQAIKLNQKIEVTGTAAAYSGAPIDNANVRFSVSRNATYPRWWYWYYSNSNSQSQSQQIAHGKIKTDGEGNFTITFVAKPDLTIPVENDPSFTFSIHADVVSPDGETRSGDAMIRAGYTALKINITSSEELLNNTTFPLIISTQTLNGSNLPADVHTQIYKLKEPEQPIRKKFVLNIWEQSGKENLAAEFGDNWTTWPKDKMVYNANMSTDNSNPDTIFIKLPIGLYKVECVAKDSSGKEVKAFLPLMVLPEWDAAKFNLKLPSIAKVKNTSVEVGEELQALWGTGYESGRCFIEIEHDNTILKSYWTDENRTQQTFSFPITENLRGGFFVHFTQVRENRAYLNSIPIYVPWDNKELKITKEIFRDKLAPGEHETVTLKIKGKKNPIDATEMVATMYDFSLDQFAPHSWSQFNFFKHSYSQRQDIFINSIQSYSTWHTSWNEYFQYPTIDYTHFPNYVVENFFYYQFPKARNYQYSSQTETIKSKGEIIYGKVKVFKGDYGRFEGKVVDALTGETLVGANVIIVRTSLGAAIDINGNFLIPKVPAGVYTVKVSWVGYQSCTLLNVKSEKGKITTINFRLAAQSIQGEAVVVTAQARGQNQAINQQLVPSSISNIVSSDMAKNVSDANIPELKEGLQGTAVQKNEENMNLEPLNLQNITIRKNLNETALFYPHLLMDKDSTVKIEFTMPEALTTWKFMAFAHGKECENGTLTSYAITQKDLMVQPNAPRFLREGDTISFTAKVVNMSNQPQNGRVQLDFKDLNTEQSVDSILGLRRNVQAFELKAHSSESFSWIISVPKGMGAVSYTVAAKTDSLSDGEAGALPVLSSRIFLTESVPLNIRGSQTKKFIFQRLTEIEKSKTLEPYRFTIQMASNPTWYAIQALPYLMEFPYECIEQIFNRYYANSLAGYIANSNPRIKQVFDAWRNTGTLKSNLEKNQELKSVMLMETPWVVQTQNETHAKQNLASLFEENTLQDNIHSAFSKLKSRQSSDGSWSWFPGGPPNDYMTLYIATGFGRLKHLGVQTDTALALKAIEYLDRWIKRTYDDIRDRSLNHLSPTVALYLYCRSFYRDERPIPHFAKEAVDYYIKQSEEHWLSLDSRLSQGYLALALHRFGSTTVPKKILASIKERSVQDDEVGMFWREDELSWWWYRAPIETQALMIEAFAEVTHDTISMEDCKVWLLKQKQTQNWKTTKATADAVYALILRGTDYLSNTKPVEVKVGTLTVTPETVEAGTGFFEKTYLKNQIVPQFANISVKKEDTGIAWGGAHFQYFEEMSNVTSHETNLKLEKKLFVKSVTKKGTVIEPIAGSLSVGDIVTVRIILRVDRDMEYVHLKDMRGSGLEPVDILSQYRYQDGLRYYQSTKDAATHFFIDYLPKGTYVFEYDLRVQLKGQYQNGVAEIQCMYAPEFNSHSESQRIEVR